jgi:hypothetical protein
MYPGVRKGESSAKINFQSASKAFLKPHENKLQVCLLAGSMRILTPLPARLIKISQQTPATSFALQNNLSESLCCSLLSPALHFAARQSVWDRESAQGCVCVHLNFPESVPSFASVFRHFGCCAAATLLFVLTLHSALCALFLSLSIIMEWNAKASKSTSPLCARRRRAKERRERKRPFFFVLLASERAKKTKVSVRMYVVCIAVLLV